MLKLATKFAPVKENFERAWQAGFRYAEFWLNAELLSDWPAIVELSRDYPFDYVLHFPNQSRLEEETLIQVVRLYRALNCQTMVIHPPFYKKFAGPLREIDSGLSLAVENSPFKPEELNRWPQEYPHLTLDVEHVWKFTYPEHSLTKLLSVVRRLFEQRGKQIRHIHMPGYFPGGNEHRPMYCSRDLVFEVFTLLDEFGFEGFIVSEIDRKYQTLIDLQMDVLLFQLWRAQCENP